MKIPLCLTLFIYSVGYAILPSIPFNWSSEKLGVDTNGLDCEEQLHKYCQRKFSTNMDPDATEASITQQWDNFTIMETLINNRYLRPDFGYGPYTVCFIRQKFQECLGVQYDSCMNPYNIIRDTKDLLNAYRYTSLFQSLEFKCNGGFIQIQQNWPCLFSIYNSTSFILSKNKCISNYVYSIAKKVDFCTAGQTLLLCVTQTVESFDCTKNADGSQIKDIFWVECEKCRVALQIEGKCPLLTCSKVVFGPTGITVDTRHTEYVSKLKRSFYDAISHGRKKRQ